MLERNMDSHAEAVELSDQARSQLDAFRAKHKTQVLTIFFSDQVESTRQQMGKGNIRAAALRQSHRQLVRDQLTHFDGIEVETAGDANSYELCEAGAAGLAPLIAPPATQKAWPAGTDEVPGEAQRSRAAGYRRIAAVVALIAITATALDALAMDPASRAKKTETHAEQEAINARGAEAKARDNLRQANHQLGLAYLERARTLDEQGRFTSALLTGAVATGFEGLDSPLGKHYPRLLEPATPTPVQDKRLLRPWRLVRPLWRSPSIQHHAHTVSSVRFSPDGKTLASASFDNTIRLWEVATGNPIATLEGHGSTVNSVSFSPDGKTLASGSLDKTIRLWEVPKPWSVPPRELLNFRFNGLEIEYLPAGEPNLLYGSKGYYRAPN
jgi:hypothetical protein